MKRVLRDFSMSVIGLLIASAVASAQLSTARLSGRVTDQSGAVLPGVTVTVTRTDTGFTRTDVTDGNGSYVLPNLPTGPYRLDVSLAGFRTYVQTGIVLQVAGTPTINVVLTVGALEETVTVAGASPLVDVQSAGVSEVVRTEEIMALPLNGRNAADLVAIVGAAVRTGEANSRSMQGGVAYSVAGGQSFGVAFLLDGAMHNDPQNNLNLPLPFPDALQEFRVATSGLTAENGMHSGASVSAVTKSGTNRFSGNVFEFLRDHRFNAINPFALKKPNGKPQDDGLRRNQFGGTFGGPIVRNKLFFFGAYQGTIVRQTPAANIAWVPSAAMLAGDFTAFASPDCNAGRQVTLRGGFENNRIAPARFSPAALNLVKRLPSTTDPCGQITYTSTDDSTEGQAVGRIDYQWTSNHSLFGRYMATSVKNPTPLTRSDSVLSLYNTTRAAGVPGLDKLAQSFAAGDTLVFGSNTVNSLRFAFNRTAIDRLDTPLFDPYALGSNVYSYDPGAMVLAVTGGFNIANPGAGLFISNSSQFSDDLTLVRGKHEMSVGANVAYWTHNFFSHARSGGDWLFTGQLTGLGMSDFLLGRVGRLEHGGPAILPMNEWYLGLYAQDTWRATSRMTINAGLRWEPYFGANVLNGAVYNFSLDNFRKNIKTTVFKNAPAGFIYPGDAGFPPGTTGLNTQWWNLSPRVGVAWDVTGNGRTAIRSAYGITYDFPTAEYQLINANSPPFGNRSLVEDPPGGFDNPYAHLVGGDPHPIITSPDTQYIPFGAYGATAPDINSPRIQQWNVTFERQIGKVWQVSASYLGSYTDRLWNQVAINPGVFRGLGPCTLNGVFYATCSTNANLNQRRVFSLSGENPAAAQLIGNMDVHTDIGTQTYRGLKLAFQRRAASGVSLNGNYTWSRCFGDATTPGGGFPQIANGYTNPDDPAFDRGHCLQDRTHIGSFTVGAQTRKFASRALRALASDWRVSGILSAVSGSWLNIITGGDNALTGIQQQRVNQVSDDVYGEKSLTRYLNRAAFAQPAAGTLGSYVRNSIKGPGFWVVDAALSRQLSVGGGRSMEFRVETFNLLNTLNLGNPVTNFNSGSFGRITSLTGAPRIMQFAVKYGF